MERLPALLCRLPRFHLLSRQTFHPPQLFARGMAAKASTNHDAPRIHILGAGNLGQYLARGLVKQNPQLPVTLLFHRAGLLSDWKEAGEEIECVTDGTVDRTGGIDVELVDGTEDQSTPIKHLIVACKTYMAVPALKQVQSQLDRDSTIVFLQNGMGTTEEVTKELFPSASARPTYWAGICVLGVSSTKPFSIIPAGRGLITLGPVVEDIESHQTDGDSHPDSFLIQQLAQIEYPESMVVTPPGLRIAQLRKLVSNAIINPLTAVLNCKNGELLDHDTVHPLIEALVEEAGPVVRALLPPSQSTNGEGDEDGFSDEELLKYVVRVAWTTAENTSSMLQDVRNGKTTEIDYINGFIALEGERLGLSCEKDRILVDMVKNGETLKPEEVSKRFDLER